MEHGERADRSFPQAGVVDTPYEEHATIYRLMRLVNMHGERSPSREREVGICFPQTVGVEDNILVARLEAMAAAAVFQTVAVDARTVATVCSTNSLTRVFSLMLRRAHS